MYAICIIKNYAVHIRSLKQALLNHGLILKNVHKVIQFNQEAWLKEYIDMNTELRKQAKTYFGKDLFKIPLLLYEDDFVICRKARMDMCLCYQVDI